MKNLKVLALVMVLVFAIGALTACGTKPAAEPATTEPAATEPATTEPAPAPAETGLKDGVYTAEQDAADQYGWKGFVEIEVKDGKIATVTFDYKNGDALKSKDAGYKEQMEKVTKTYPEKAFAELQAALVEKQDIAAVEAVAGATTSSTEFTALVTKALETAK